MKEDNRFLFTPKNKYVRHFIKKAVHGERVLACNKNIVSKSFNDVVNVLKIFMVKIQKILFFDKCFKHINTIKNNYKENYEASFTEHRRKNKRKLEDY